MAHAADVTALSEHPTGPAGRRELAYEPAGPAERALAFLVDLVIAVVCTFLVGLLVAWISRDLSELTAWVVRIAAVAYFPYMWLRHGQTIGMMPFHQRVVRSTDLGPIDVRTALIRVAALALSIASVIGVLWILRDPKRQGWHDKVAGTLVISG